MQSLARRWVNGSACVLRAPAAPATRLVDLPNASSDQLSGTGDVAGGLVSSTAAATMTTSSTTQVYGWVRSVRRHGQVAFLDINDGSRLAGLQVVVENTLADQLVGISTGCSVQVHGVLRPSQGRGQGVELAASEIKLVGKCDESYPLQKKRHSVEFLRDLPHLRPRTNLFGAVTRIRSRAALALHTALQDAGGFVLVAPPLLTSSDCEGAGEAFPVTGSEAMFGQQAYLSVSSQLHAEAYACAVSRAYSFSPAFRAENSHTSRHLAEFWMLEAEAAWLDLPATMGLAESLVQHTARALLEHVPEDIALCDRFVQPGVLAALQQHAAQAGTGVMRASPLHRVISYTDAVAALQRDGQGVRWGQDLNGEHERWLVDVYNGGDGLFVTDYPASLKPFYMRRNSQDSNSMDGEDTATVAAMDFLLPRASEVAGGSVREERYDELEAAMKQRGMNLQTYQWYLDLRRYGTVPHAGFGIGFERLLSYLTGVKNIRDLVAVPRFPGELKQ